MMFVRAYLRASTKEQDATRAKAELEAFAEERELTIASFYVENVSGASLKRPELFRLLDDCQPNDILLVEQVDRLSRLNSEDWESLKALIGVKRVRVVALDLPTSYQMASNDLDEFTIRMFEAVNAMMLDMIAAIARKDHVERRKRQAQGIQKAKAQGRYRGRPVNKERNEALKKMLDAGQSWSSIVKATGVSRSTLARLAKQM